MFHTSAAKLRSRAVLSACCRSAHAGALALACPAAARADNLFIEEDTTIDGSAAPPDDTLVIDPAAGLFISHGSNDPLLTLINGATTEGVETVVVGSLDGESGRLRIEGGSTLESTVSGSGGTFGSEQVFIGWAYLGLNAGSAGEAEVIGEGSTWNSSSMLHVGHAGTGTLTIADGGKVSSSTGSIGHVIGIPEPASLALLGLGSLLLARRGQRQRAA